MEHIDRILGYGIPSKIFNDKFALLSKEKQQTLESVARRLQTIKKLTYESLFLFNPNGEKEFRMTFGRWEISSIQIYLYCTCIDTLAGKQDYMEFYQWLKTKNLSNLDKDKIDEYHEEYLDDYGDRRSFSKLFLNLPPSVKSWLNQNISIQQSNVYEVVESRNETELVRRLIDYFYKSWRNPFTHQSVTRPVEFIDGINSLDEHYSRIGISDLAKREWFCQPDSFHIGNENIKWHLWHRKEIDPAFILKIIIQSVVFQWLDINVTEELVTKIVYRFNRLYWMYAYIHEIRGNAEYIDLWRDINEEYSPKIVSNLRSFGVPQLSSTASSKILELFRADNVMEKSLREHIQGYIKCVTNINILIADLNKEYPRIEKYDKDVEARSIQGIKNFLLSLTVSSDYKEIIKHSHQSWTVWLLIRDNSEYESKNWNEP